MKNNHKFEQYCAKSAQFQTETKRLHSYYREFQLRIQLRNNWTNAESYLMAYYYLLRLLSDQNEMVNTLYDELRQEYHNLESDFVDVVTNSDYILK